MLNQNGGIIGPANIPTTTSAKGKWSLAEYYLAKRQNIWPSVTPNADPYFNYTTLLLPGTGTNGAQNNTFLDGSTNNFTITRNGNTTQGTFSPFSQTGWGNYFDGTGDSLTVSYNAAFEPSSSDFTIEGWYFLTETGVTENPFFVVGSATYYPIGVSFLSSTGWKVQINASYTGSAWAFNRTGTTTVSANTWVHVAVVRNSTSLDVYVNGTKDNGASGAIAGSLASGAGGISLGAYRAGGTAEYFGYMSNVRYVVGSAVYTGNFTPSTSPLTAITNTKLLTCQSNRFIDNSTLGSTITRNGDTSVVAFSPFNPSASWSSATYGGSGYFDGSGDYLSVADNANLRFGTSAFTIQAWVYRNASGTAHSIIAKGGASTGYVLQVTSTNVLRFTHGTTNVDTTTTIPASAWTHVAAVRTNTSTNGFQLYINGVSSATATVSTDFNQTDTLYIGGDRSAANVMNGYISGLKYTNGTAETISVPTEPPTATTNVALLTNFTNAGIYDATSKNDLETVGNAQISTTQFQFAPSSMAFDGNGDYLIMPDVQTGQFLTGDFTVEYWCRFGSQGTNYAPQVGTLTSASPSGTWRFGTFTNNGGVYLAYHNGSTYVDLQFGSTAYNDNTWRHFALTRSGTTVRAFVNGTQVGTNQTVSQNFNSSNKVSVGAELLTPTYFNGYIQDLRITKGYARYTANFTAPTAAFPTL